MPSDFEREYKKYIESDMPDLWSRIEAGITADEPDGAKAADEKAGSDAVVSEPSEAVKPAETPVVSDNKKIIRWGIYAKRAGQIAAAVALLFVAYFLLQFMATKGMRASESAAPMADAAAEAPAMAEADVAAADTYEAEAPDMADSAPMAEAAASDSEAPMLGRESDTISMDEAVNSIREKAAASADNRKYKADTDKTAMAEDAEAAAEETDEIYPESAEFESAKLIDMTEIAPAERVTSSSGTQYKFGLTFETDDMTVYCLISESDIKHYAENGVHLNKGESYKIDIDLREDIDPADSRYPYLLKAIENAK